MNMKFAIVSQTQTHLCVCVSQFQEISIVNSTAGPLGSGSTCGCRTE